ncbi:probable plastidic glucose transporter 3 [Camellia sinensis]|uniref:probable plastidic glucose transporter 3 n=1 Tax=Camellia sinensis TaxID=4442 RepID=UPI001035D841|nr:probable plastidic glucose transporter 3 [Camellia sinensis]
MLFSFTNQLQIQTIWWRVCFWVSAIPAAVLAVLMEFCAESPHWLFKRGRIAEAEIEFEKLLGGSHFKSAVSELSKSDRGDEADALKFSELFYGRHFKVVFIGSTLFALQQLSGINAVFYFSSAVFRSVGVPSDIANICVGIANLSVYWCVFVGTSCKRRPPDFCYFEDIDWLIHSLSRFVKGTRPYMFPILCWLEHLGGEVCIR